MKKSPTQAERIKDELFAIVQKVMEETGTTQAEVAGMEDSLPY